MNGQPINLIIDIKPLFASSKFRSGDQPTMCIGQELKVTNGTLIYLEIEIFIKLGGCKMTDRYILVFHDI